MPDVAKDLFEKFTSANGYAEIMATIDAGQREGHYLDYKEVTTNDGSVTLEARKALAKEISGFANASGGVIIWGIRSKQKNEIPAATLVHNLAKFADNLRRLSTDLVHPAAICQHVPVPDPSGGDKGFLLSYIPEARPKGIMWTFEKEYRYYLREDDKSKPQHDTVVRGLMADRGRVELALQMSRRSVKFVGIDKDPALITFSQRGHFRVKIELELRNAGTALARDPGVIFLEKKHGGFTSVVPFANILLPIRDVSVDFNNQGVYKPGKLIRPVEPVLYPGVATWIAAYEFIVTTTTNEMLGIYLDYMLVAEDFTISQRGSWQMLMNEINGYEAAEKAYANALNRP